MAKGQAQGGAQELQAAKGAGEMLFLQFLFKEPQEKWIEKLGLSLWRGQTATAAEWRRRIGIVKTKETK